MNEDYDATELEVETDELITETKEINEINEWIWGSKLYDNKIGWLPKRILKEI